MQGIQIHGTKVVLFQLFILYCILNWDLLQVIEHVYEKVMNGGSEAGSGAGTPTGDRSHTDNGRHDREDTGSVAEDRVELLCNDTILDPNMDLRNFVSKEPIIIVIINLGV